MPLPTPDAHTWLIAAAAPGEARAILEGTSAPGADVAIGAGCGWAPILASPTTELLITGVGKANAAGALAHALDPTRHAGVIALGLCGSLPGSDLSPTEVVIATESVYADEGVAIPGGFTDLAAMGFPPGPSEAMSIPNADHAARLLRAEDAPIGLRLASGRIATVSTCSGTDAHARQVVARTGAVAEAMEGAALAFTLARLAPRLPFCEVRVVSNTTGDRADQQWDLKGALAILSRIAASL